MEPSVINLKSISPPSDADISKLVPFGYMPNFLIDIDPVTVSESLAVLFSRSKCRTLIETAAFCPNPETRRLQSHLLP